MRQSLWLGAGVVVMMILLMGALVAAHQPGATMILYTVAVGASPAAVAVDGAAGRALVLNAAEDGPSVSVLDTGGGRVVRTVALGHAPTAVAVDARAHRAFILMAVGASVTVLDTRTGRVLHTLGIDTNAFGPGVGVGDVAVDEASGHAFVTAGGPTGPGALVMLDGRSGTVQRVTGLGGHPQHVAVDGHTHRAFVTNFEDNSVSILDTRSGRLLRTVPVGAAPSEVTVDERSGHVFVSNFMAGSVSVLDAQDGEVLHTVTVGRNPQDVAVDARTGRVFVLNSGDSTVSVLDARAGTLRRSVALDRRAPGAASSPPRLVGVMVDHVAGHAFVLSARAADGSKPAAGEVSVLDGASGRVLRTITAGAGPAALALDEARGRLLVANGGPAIGTSGQGTWDWLPLWLRQLIRGPMPLPPVMGGTVTIVAVSPTA